MNNHERVRDLVDKYVKENGSETEMTRGEFLEWVHETYENISAAKNNLYPTDISFNLYNAGLKDFPGPCLCLVYVEERETFRLVGSGYKHTGPIWQYKGKSNEKIVGQWINGTLKMGEITDYDLQLSEDVLIQRENLENGIKKALSAIPVVVASSGKCVTVHFQELLISGVSIEDECYKIYNASSEWADKTSYLCEEKEDGTWFYYLETIDECIGEMQRLVMFEAQKGKNSTANKAEHTSELSQVVTAAVFEKAYAAFIDQADKNASSGKAQGSKTPYGFSEKPECDGAHFKPQYGQGAPSAAPYMNWWVVSIYYLPNSGNIIMGIEEDRYSHLKEMSIKPLRYDQIGNKKVNTAVFYSTNKSSVDYGELHEKFISVCEEVMRLGIREKDGQVNSVYLSGNGPLVKVLTDALNSNVFVKDLHKVENEFLRNGSPDFNSNVIVFDEGQRAWDVEQMKAKKRGDFSEPDVMIQLAEECLDWCVLLILVGEGQEIYKGENSGISQWNTAIDKGIRDWEVVYPSKLKKTFASQDTVKDIDYDVFDLTVSLRSHLAGDVSSFVNYVIDGEIKKAAGLADSIYEAGYSMYFTRDLNAAKEYCRDRYEGCFNKRYGMMTSSKAYDLKKYGIGPAFRPDVAGWFNADPGNSRSSCALSVAISEFDCQGLEIDMPIIGWGQDLQWSSKGWKPNADEGTDDYDYRINSYRVLLTRGRDGFIIFVPPGLDNVADVFKKAGIKEL